METIEMPTQMTSNVPAPVGSGSNFEMSTPGVAETEKPDVSIQTTPGVEVEDKLTADRLLESAKDEGFEEALKRLANGDFDQDEVKVENVTEPELEPVGAIKVEEEVGDKEKNDLPSDEIMPLREHIARLEEKVNILEDENRKLLERAKESERANKANQEIILTLAMVLHELAEKEENEDEKVNVLQLLVDMLAYFLKETMTEYNETEENKNNNVRHIRTRSGGTSDNLAKLMQLVSERGQSFNDPGTQGSAMETPHIEKVAA